MSGNKSVHGGAVAAAFSFLACSVLTCSIFGSFHLSAGNLDIGPDPAGPGDTVVASFSIRIAPVQRHTVVLTIDGKEHLRATSTEAPPLISVIQLGDALALIAAYGVGMHLARVEVRAEEKSESARTQSVGFELRDTVP